MGPHRLRTMRALGLQRQVCSSTDKFVGSVRCVWRSRCGVVMAIELFIKLCEADVSGLSFFWEAGDICFRFHASMNPPRRFERVVMIVRQGMLMHRLDFPSMTAMSSRSARGICPSVVCQCHALH